MKTSHLKSKILEACYVLEVVSLKIKSSESNEFNFGFQKEIQMARALFSGMVLRKSSEITNSKPTLISTIFFLKL